MPTVLRDVLHGFRVIRRAPGLASTAGLTLGLGIAALTALVSVVNAVILDPLPFPESTRLVQIWRSELPALTYGSASFARFLDWKERQRAFTDLGAFAPQGMTLAGAEGPERVSGATASSSLFDVLGGSPRLGRWFTAAEDRPGADRVAVISEALWQRRFGAATTAIGRALEIDGTVYTVIGVAPAAMAEVWRFDVWVPLAPTATRANRGNNYLVSFGRLRDGVTLAQARTQFDGLARELTRDYPDDRYTFTLRDLHDVVTEGATRGLWVLLGATVLLLIISCTNVTNLLLARAVARERELAVRASLGASRRQLVSQVLGETVALGMLGSVLGLGLAWALLRGFVAMAPPNFPRLAAIALDLRVFAVALVVAVGAGVLAGLVPALQQLRSVAAAALQSGGSRGTTSGRVRRTGRWLAGAELAVALALVAAAGLMMKSLLRLQDADLGVTRAPVLTFTVSVPAFVADGPEALVRFQSTFLQRIRALPGVTHASAINMLPVAATGNNGPVRRLDQPGELDGVPVTEMRVVLEGYVETMGVRLIAGRAIDDRDHDRAPPVVVVNEAVAARLWPGRPAAEIVGQRLRTPWSDMPREVIGVVANVRSRRPDLPPDPEVHAPFRQLPVPGLAYVVRGQGDPFRLAAPLRAALAELSPHVALASVRSFDDVIATATRTSGLLSWLSVLFGGLAAVLAAVGIYGVMSYTVAQRERELAVRAAVGATRGTLVTMILREGAQLSLAGLAAGLLLAWAVSGVLSSLLFEVSATDAGVFAAAVLALGLVALAGYAVPALRASRVAPVTALRAE